SDDAEKFRRIILGQQARKGGKQRQADALQRAIIQVVHGKPTVTVKQLEELLTREHCPSLVEDNDGEYIYFTEPDGGDEGRLKKAKISALKHRLSRGKRSRRSP